MSQIVVTSGKRFTDIDALACVLAYAEIPTSPSIIPILPGPLNQSITDEIKRWPLQYQTNLKPGDYDFVITDVSEESQFASFVDQKRIIKLFDHHFGFEKHWRDKIGAENVKIETVGACATLIWEEIMTRKWEIRREKLENEIRSENSFQFHTSNISLPNSSFPHPTSHFQISSTSANLLYTAIISNTLNFHSSLTTARDKKAFTEITPFTDLPENWIAQYYLAQENDIYENPILALRNDTKVQSIQGRKCAVGQMELWDSRDFLKEYAPIVEGILKEYEAETWLFLSPCISEGRSYVFTRDESLKNALKSVLNITFEKHIGITTKLWLRKEILKKIQ